MSKTPVPAGVLYSCSETENMSKFTLAVQSLLLTTLALTSNAALPQANNDSESDPALTGHVSMEGTILSSACDIDTGDGYQAIAMPSETRAHIKKNGEGDPQYFSIRLTNCSLDSFNGPTTWQYINIIFDGDEDQGMFHVNGSASGIALELLDRNGTIIRPGKAMPWAQEAVTDNRLDYRIKLKNTLRDLVVGDYRAIIRYRIEYF